MKLIQTYEGEKHREKVDTKTKEIKDINYFSDAQYTT